MRPEYNVRSDYIGTGLLDTYTFDFKIDSLNQLIVMVTDENYVETFKVRGDDVTFLSSVTFDNEIGGTVVLVDNLPEDHLLTILFANDGPVQESKFRNKSDFTLKRIEDALDVVTGAVQRLSYLTKRSLRISDTMLDNDVELMNTLLPINEVTLDNAGKMLIVGTDGSSFAFGPDYREMEAVAVTEAAAASADAAGVSAAASAASATAASGSATAASGSATAASGSATAANASAVSAAASAASAASALVLDITAKTANYTLVAADELVTGDATGGAFTLTLPTAVGISGKVFTLKKIDSSLVNQITVATTSSQTIDGVTTTKLATPYETIQVVSNGANWILLQRTYPSIITPGAFTYTGFGAPTQVENICSRDGKFLVCTGYLVSGTASATGASIVFPSGLTIEGSNKFSTQRTFAGVVYRSLASTSTTLPGASVGPWVLYANTGNVTDLFFSKTSNVSANLFASESGNALVSPGDALSYNFKVPIVGWN